MESLVPDESGKSHQFNEIYRFFEFSLDLFAISGFDGYLKRVNPAWERTLGYTAEELLSRPAMEFIHPEDRAVSLTKRKQAHNGSPVINFENRYICKDGSIKWMEWVAYPYPEHGLNYVVGRDVTERKQAEDVLHQSQEAMRGLLNGMPNRAVLMQPDGTILMANDLQAAALGFPLEELLGKNIYDMTKMETEMMWQRRATVKEAIATGKPMVVELERGGKYLETTITPIRSESGEVVSVVISSHEITHLKEVEEGLRHSEATLREFVDAFPGLTVVTNLEGNLMAFNEQFAARYRTAGVDLASQNIYNLLSPLNAEQRKPYSQAVMESQKPVHFQSESKGRFFDVTIFPIFDADKKVVRLGSYVQDVTDLKYMEGALRQSELTVRDLLNGSPDMAFLTDNDGKLIAFNKNFSEQFDWDESTLIGTSINYLLPADFVYVRGSITSRVLETCQPVREEIEYHGQIFDYTVYPILNETQEVTSLATFSQDITQRKQVEQKLRNSEQQFRSVLESAAEGILLTDSTGAILLVNRRVEDLFGYTREELFGQSVDALLMDSQRDIHAAHRQNYYAEPASRSMGIGLEVFGQRKDGTAFPIEVSLSYLQNDEGLLVMALVSDISERKQIEQEHLDNQRIQLEVKQEREIIALRQQFMSMVSHEFRTPLTVIASSTEILQHYDDRLSRERRMEKLQVINGQVRMMVTLLDDILALNKFQAGVADFSPESVDLLALCLSVLNNIKIMDQDQHHFIFDSQAKSAPVLADRRSLEHSITNLLANAIKYSPSETTIQMSIHSVEQSINLEIHDEGIGIPPEEQKHLFEPFYRASNARKIDGTGLGLAIVKHNVEQHGGTITCRSTVGQGTTFSIRLPMATGA